MVTDPSADRPLLHSCGREMVASRFDHNHRHPWYRSQPIWLCVHCSRCEPDGWDPEDPKGWMLTGVGWQQFQQKDAGGAP